MEVKLFEVRDALTYMPSIAIRCNPANVAEQCMLSRAGYGMLERDQRKFVLFGRESDLRLRYDIGSWRDRTLTTAHQYIHDHWDELTTGQVIDVEFILVELISPKVSDN